MLYSKAWATALIIIIRNKKKLTVNLRSVNGNSASANEKFSSEFINHYSQNQTLNKNDVY